MYLFNILSKTVLAFVLCVASVNAEAPSYLVQVETHFGNTQVDTGCGALIDAEHVITCWHNLRNFTPRSKVYVVLQDGSRIEVEVLKRDQVPDLALLKLSKPTLVPSINLANEEPRFGDTVTIESYQINIVNGNAEREYIQRTGQVKNRFAASQQGPDILYTVTVRTRPGNSGSPVVDKDGKLCGILFGSLARAHVTGIEAIYQFIDGETNDSKLLR